MLSPSLSRRRFLRSGLVGATVVAAGALSACSTQSGEPSITVLYPYQGARVPDVPVIFRVALRNFARTRGEETLRPGSVFFLVDTPLESLQDGQAIPSDQPDKFVEAEVAPITERAIQLEPGVHTVSVFLADEGRLRMPAPAPVTLTIFVQPGGVQTK